MSHAQAGETSERSAENQSIFVGVRGKDVAFVLAEAGKIYLQVQRLPVFVEAEIGELHSFRIFGTAVVNHRQCARLEGGNRLIHLGNV